MKTTPVARHVGELFLSDFFVIPRFQRPFSWTVEQLEEFWTDVIDEHSNDYFLGAVVVYPLAKGQHIVDGQQRLTTCTMLLCAVRDLFRDAGSEDLAAGVHQYIERQDRDNVASYVLKPATSTPFFHNAIQAFATDAGSVQTPRATPTPATDEEARLAAAHKYLVGRLKKQIETIREDSKAGEKRTATLVENYLKKVRDSVIDLQVIFLSLDGEDSAYTVFETLNTRGLDLRLVDKIRNYVMNSARAANPDGDRAKAIWETDVLEVLQKSAAGIDEDAFLVHYWLSRYDYVTKKEVFKRLKKRFNKEQHLRLPRAVDGGRSLLPLDPRA